MAISRQKEARSREEALLLSNDFKGSLWYMVQHCTFHTFEQIGALLYAQPLMTNVRPWISGTSIRMQYTQTKLTLLVLTTH